MHDKQAERLHELIGEVRRCRLCRNLPLGPRPLLQCSASAKILIAGQAPGKRTHLKGIPFDDLSGTRLREWLGVDRETFYDAGRIAILPMGFCYPGTGTGGDLPPRPECAPAWRERLLAGMPSVELTILIGLHAQRWHLGGRGRKTVSENVQSWMQYWPSMIALPHPSPRNMAWMQQHPEVERTLLPMLRLRVHQLLR